MLNPIKDIPRLEEFSKDISEAKRAGIMSPREAQSVLVKGHNTHSYPSLTAMRQSEMTAFSKDF